MKYYSIHFTLNPIFRGSNDYIKNYNIKIPDNKLFWEEPKFIGNVNNEEINFKPYLVDIELFANSKMNDLIMEGGPIPRKLIVSEKLKSILEKHRKTGMQFFNINIIKKNKIFNNYWILNMHEKNYEVIDFEKTKFYETKNTFELNKELKINSLKELIQVMKKIESKGYPYGFLIGEIILSNIIAFDFFILTNIEGGIRYVVSEKLKNDIENERCEGLEFKPLEISLQDWYHNGKRDEIYGKSW